MDFSKFMTYIDHSLMMNKVVMYSLMENDSLKCNKFDRKQKAPNNVGM